MKLFFTLSLCAITAVTSFGQQRLHPHSQPVNHATKITNNNLTQFGALDTLWGSFPFGSNTSGTAIPTMWTGSKGDWVAGNNSYGDVVKAQAFTVTNPYVVKGCIFLFGYKHYGSANPNSKVVASLYDMDGTGTLSTGQGTTPNTLIGGTSVNILVSAIDTSSSGAAGFVSVTFPTPFNASSDYAVGIDLSTITANDTVAMVCSDTISPVAIDMSFDKWSDGTWHSFLESTTPNWGLNADIAIFPIVDKGAGVNDERFINGIKIYQNYPNPFKTSSVLTYELENNANNITVFINDLNGKLIKKMELGKIDCGQHTLNLNAEDFASGTYYVLVQADHNRLAKKMTIAK